MATEGVLPWEAGDEPWSELRSTHSGAVLLLGDRAFKFKLPVSLGFLDFTTLASREEACRREVELNRRIAPDTYLGVGSLAQPGGAAEPVVVMRRLPAAARLQSRVQAGEDVSEDVERLARLLAAFHARAHRGPDVDREGTRDAIAQRWEASFAQVRAGDHVGIDDRVLADIERLTRAFLEGREDLFEDRVRHGRIVDGHGDLLAEDIFCLPDGPRVLDCLDFDARLRALDQLDDVCCLAMDLERLGDPAASRLLLSTYAEHTADLAPPALVHHFMAYRAFVRAKVGCLRGAVADLAEVAEHAWSCVSHLRAGAVRLILVGGPPGTGKTTLAGGLADRVGCTVLSSDRVRKELAGLDPEAPAPAAYGTGLYDRPHRDATYDELLRRATLLLARGESVVLDATWADRPHRRAAERVAELTSAELVTLRCSLPVELARARIQGRTGPSDADADVATRAAATWPSWPGAHSVDTRLDPKECSARAAAVVRGDPARPRAAVPLRPR